MEQALVSLIMFGVCLLVALPVIRCVTRVVKVSSKSLEASAADAGVTLQKASRVMAMKAVAYEEKIRKANPEIAAKTDAAVQKLLDSIEE